MLYSKLFGKTRKSSKEYDTINATYLTKAGFVNQLMAGAYTMLPLGLRVLRKIESIIREEMNAVGGQEILMPALHPAENWKKTGGWDNIDVLFKLKSRTERDYALGSSEEEVVTPLVKENILSQKELPLAVYHIQNKFRDELRAKSGILRGREFGMKDMYSFHEDEKDFLKLYEYVKEAYLKVFERVGLDAKVTEASGGSFSEKISYEFMVITDAGEDDIYHCDSCNYCINTEISKVKEGDKCPKCKGRLVLARASEAGNVFDLGQKYSKDFALKFVDKSGNDNYPHMGCYGIGTTRLMGITVENHHDDKGIIWPESVAPYKVHLIGLNLDDLSIKKRANDLYKDLISENVEVLFDDRSDISPGEKFADADLIGIPYRLVISKKTGDKVELKKRSAKKLSLMDKKDTVKLLT